MSVPDLNKGVNISGITKAGFHLSGSKSGNTLWYLVDINDISMQKLFLRYIGIKINIHVYIILYNGVLYSDI